MAFVGESEAWRQGLFPSFAAPSAAFFFHFTTSKTLRQCAPQRGTANPGGPSAKSDHPHQVAGLTDKIGA